jgi:hypothetical protein
MHGRLIRVRNNQGGTRPREFIVATDDSDEAIEIIRDNCGKPGDDISDLGRVSMELDAALELAPGGFRSLNVVRTTERAKCAKSAMTSTYARSATAT